MIGIDTVSVVCGLVLGGALAGGVCLIFAALPRWGAPRLERRIAAYIRDVSDPLGLTPIAPIRFRGGARATVDRIGTLLGGTSGVMRRLAQSGSTRTAASFRAEQLGWAVAGLGAGALVTIASIVAGRGNPAIAVAPIIMAVAGFVVRDMLLTRAAQARQARVAEELPLVLEFLALCLSAGEGILDALRRVSEVGAGELPRRLHDVVLEARMGAPLAGAMTEMAHTVGVLALTRACDQLVTALDRGAPLAGVLQSQADDAREDAKRRLIEQAGRKEISMMIPLVFLILPLSVLFAVFPGIFMLRLGI